MQWSDINAELAVLLKDTTGVTYPEDLRKRAFNRAAQYFATTHTALLRTSLQPASAHASGSVVSLPDDFLELPSGGVQAGTTWLEPAIINPGDQLPKTGYMTLGDQILVFDAQTPEVTLWYFGTYNTVTATNSNIDLPTWAVWAVINLTLAYVLYPEMTAQAQLRQFQGQREEGKPEDNPARKQAQYFRQVYDEIVNKRPPQDRGVLYRPG